MEDTVDTIVNKTDVLTSDELQVLNQKEVRNLLPCIVFLGILIPLGIIGNVSVLVIFTRYCKKTVYRIFILCLAAIDVLICALGIPFAMVEILLRYVFTAELLCKVFFTLKYMLVMASIFTLFGLSLDRYRNVCHPLKRQLTTKAAKCFCIVIFCSVASLCWPAYFFVGIRDSKCDGDPVLINSKLLQYYIIFMSLICLLTMSSLVLMYILIGRRIFMQIKFRKTFQADVSNTSTTDDNSGETKGKRQKTKINTIAFIICTFFMISYVPYIIITFAMRNNSGNIILCIVQRFIYLNSVINPLVYGFLDIRFRGILKKYSLSCLHLKPCKVQTLEK